MLAAGMNLRVLDFCRGHELLLSKRRAQPWRHFRWWNVPLSFSALSGHRLMNQ
jgi:hypothetical protein